MRNVFPLGISIYIAGLESIPGTHCSPLHQKKDLGSGFVLTSLGPIRNECRAYEYLVNPMSHELIN